VIGRELGENRANNARAAGDLADFLRHVMGEHRMTPGITFWPEPGGTVGAFLELTDGTIDDVRLPVGLDELIELTYRLAEGDVRITLRHDAQGRPWIGFLVEAYDEQIVATTRPADLGRRWNAQATRDQAFQEAWARMIQDEVADA
jgi:hypothetical protein